ncbi:MAG: 2,3-bisphosphoglycerate-independent phosphoglycerate mutase [Pyrinomonadaceae bacterium]|nr:2,3-bisphosphoglycerate-independent phosphoglycerate mutase [Pyrinomonadaceae bacterium]
MNRVTERPHALIILDGWGFSRNTAGNAIAAAHTPNYDRLTAEFPFVTLSAAGMSVGLEDGVAGNAEIGHMNIGAGRVVRTAASRIHEAIRSGTFLQNDVLVSAMTSARERGASVHLIGMISDAEVHASVEHLYALLRMAKQTGHKEAFVHGILDGRDVPPRSADVFVEATEIKMAEIGIGRFASLCGRFYAMDNSDNWERTARAFTMLAFAEGERAIDAVAAIRNSFLRGISEEFIAPIVLEREPGVPVTHVTNGDLVIFFNHRPDTMRQLVRSLAVPDQGILSPAAKPWIEAICLTEYDRAFRMPVAFPAWAESNNLSDVLSANEITNLRISETERIPHVSRFLNCGNESGGQYERIIEVVTGNAAMREAEPELQSFKITDRFLRGIEDSAANVFVVNIPAAGLVAETGNMQRTVEAVQYVDTCIGGIIEKVREMNGVAIITSTHGNCETMFDGRGEPHRSPTGNPVPFHLIGEEFKGAKLRPDGSLEDVAPTLLALMGIDQPSEMTGRDLRM